MLPACMRLGLGFVPYFPLASGLLTGKYRRGEPAPAGSRLSGRDQIATEAQFELIEALEGFAREHRISPVALAIGSLLTHPRVACVIAGATTPEQVRANASALEWTPNESDLAELRSVLG